MATAGDPSWLPEMEEKTEPEALLEVKEEVQETGDVDADAVDYDTCDQVLPEKEVPDYAETAAEVQDAEPEPEDPEEKTTLKRSLSPPKPTDSQRDQQSHDEADLPPSPKRQRSDEDGEVPSKVLDLSKTNLKKRSDVEWYLGKEERNKDGFYEFTELNCSYCKLTSEGCQEIATFCKRCPKLRILKLHHNSIFDDAIEEHLMTIFPSCPDIQEIHLSHNRITEKGAWYMVVGAKSLLEEIPAEEKRRPIWMRLEHNNYWRQGAAGIAVQLKDYFFEVKICLRDDPRRCTSKRCCNNARVHIPFLSDTGESWDINELEPAKRWQFAKEKLAGKNKLFLDDVWEALEKHTPESARDQATWHDADEQESYKGTKGYSYHDGKNYNDSKGWSARDERSYNDSQGYGYGEGKNYGGAKGWSYGDGYSNAKGHTYGKGKSNNYATSSPYGESRNYNESNGYNYNGNGNYQEDRGYNYGEGRNFHEAKGYPYGEGRGSNEARGYNYGASENGFGYGGQRERAVHRLGYDKYNGQIESRNIPPPHDNWLDRESGRQGHGRGQDRWRDMRDSRSRTPPPRAPPSRVRLMERFERFERQERHSPRVPSPRQRPRRAPMRVPLQRKAPTPPRPRRLRADRPLTPPVPSRVQRNRQAPLPRNVRRPPSPPARPKEVAKDTEPDSSSYEYYSDEDEYSYDDEPQTQSRDVKSVVVPLPKGSVGQVQKTAKNWAPKGKMTQNRRR